MDDYLSFNNLLKIPSGIAFLPPFAAILRSLPLDEQKSIRGIV
ncbi:hypothetical protein [Erwinia piriflorinigrans]|nr:hypothetical protein [Erwinia piriflorinigrans]